MGPDVFANVAARLDQAAIAGGRDPRAIGRIHNVGDRITDGRSGDRLLNRPMAALAIAR